MVDMKREEWLSLMLNSLPDRHLLVDHSGHIVESFGHTSETTHQKISDLLPAAISSKLQKTVARALSSGEIQQIQYSLSPCQQLQLSIEELIALGEMEEQWFESTFKPVDTSAGEKFVLWQERNITQAFLREAELKRLSETDELTGILNRRAFLVGLEQEFHMAEIQSLSCLMIDIDHFKEINDQVGHMSGDEVIIHVARICQQSIRSCDYIGRLGGEEFGVVLSGVNAIQAYDIAETLRSAIEASPCTVDGNSIYPTVSIGIAETNEQITSVKALLVNADKAMYYSKQTGRNQVTLYYDNLPDIKSNAQRKAKILKAS